MSLRLGQVIMEVIYLADWRSQDLDSRKKIKLWLTVRHCQPNQSILMMKTMLRNKDTILSLVNELIKLEVFNDLLSLTCDQIMYIYEITRLEITCVSVKCKPLQRGILSKPIFLYAHETKRCSWIKRTQS